MIGTRRTMPYTIFTFYVYVLYVVHITQTLVGSMMVNRMEKNGCIDSRRHLV